MKLTPLDPMRTRATDNGPVDARRGAYVGFVLRERRRREQWRIRAAVDIGEPGRPWATLAFLAAAVLATVVEFATFGADPTAAEVGRAGGMGVGTIATGETWRLLASNLLHADVAHVFMNAFFIFLTGRWLEHLVGARLVVATILWSAVFTNIGALVIDAPTVSVGASGVAFGLFGCAIAVDPRARTAVGVMARQLTVVGVIATFLVSNISVGGHLGGLLAGLLVGWVGWSRRADELHPAGRLRPIPATVAIAVALPVVTALALGPDRTLPDGAHDARGTIVASLLERQLDGATLTSGLRVEHADCRQLGADLLDYECELDRERRALVRFSERTEQWSLAVAQ